LKKRLGKKIKLEVSDISKWQKMGTGTKTKEEILKDVTYVKIDTPNVNFKISNIPYKGKHECKIYWVDKEQEETTNNLYKAINVISRERLAKYEIEIFSWKDSGTSVGPDENSIRNKNNDLNEVINIISQLGIQKYE